VKEEGMRFDGENVRHREVVEQLMKMSKEVSDEEDMRNCIESMRAHTKEKPIFFKVFEQILCTKRNSIKID